MSSYTEKDSETVSSVDTLFYQLSPLQQQRIVSYLPSYNGVCAASPLKIAGDGLVSNYEVGRLRGLPRIYVGYDFDNSINSIVRMDDDTISNFAQFIFARQKLFQDSVLNMSEGSFKRSAQWHSHIHIDKLDVATINDDDYFGLAVRQAGIFAGAKIHLATSTTERSVLRLVLNSNESSPSYSIFRDFDGFVFDLYFDQNDPSVHMWWKHDGKNQKWIKSTGPGKSFRLHSKKVREVKVYICIENGVISLTTDRDRGQLFNEDVDGTLLIAGKPVYVSTSVTYNNVAEPKTENKYFVKDLSSINGVISDDYNGESLEKVRNWKAVLELNFASLQFDTLPFNLVKHKSYPILGLQMKGEYTEMDEDTKMQKMKELLRGLKMFFATAYERNNSPDFEGNPLQNLPKLLPGASIVINIAGFINDGTIPLVITEHLSDESWIDLGISSYIYLEPWTYYLYLKVVHDDVVLNDWYSNYCLEGMNFIPW